MGMSGDCCSLRNPVEVPPFWSEGAAIVYPDMFLWEKFYELDYTKRNDFKRGDAEDVSSAPMVCLGFDTYLCDKLVGVYRNVKRGIQEMVVSATLVPEMGWGLMAWFDSPNVIGLCQLTIWLTMPRIKSCG